MASSSRYMSPQLSTVSVASSRFRYNMYYFRNSRAALFTAKFPELPRPDSRGEFDFDARTSRRRSGGYSFSQAFPGRSHFEFGEGNLIRFFVAELQITMNINEPRSRSTNRRNEVRRGVVRRLDRKVSRENVRDRNYPNI